VDEIFVQQEIAEVTHQETQVEIEDVEPMQYIPFKYE
jgi:hypothetical protein